MRKKGWQDTGCDLNGGGSTKIFYKCRETKGIRFDVVAIADRAFIKTEKFAVL